MRVIIQPDYDNMSKWAANFIARRLLDFKPTKDRPFVLGLPTGSSPIGTYKELINLYKQGVISFENVITFNMDEYIGLDENHPQSYHFFMWDTFFSHIDIKRENVNIPDGNATDIEAACRAYEDKIKAVGGIDLFMGGVGSDGHIAFNEPFSSLMSRTRVKTLTKETIIANSRFFNNNLSLVPKRAVTVGVGTIMDSREVLILVNGHNKSKALHHAIEGAVSHKWTITALQMHPKGIIVCDEESTTGLEIESYDYFKDIESKNLNPENLLK